MDARRIDALHHRDFERLVKVLARSGEPIDPDFVKAFATRLRDNRVPPVVMAAAFAEAHRGAGWEPVWGALLDHLARKPEDATTILVIASQTANWPLPSVVTAQEGPPHTPEFRTEASISLPSKTSDAPDAAPVPPISVSIVGSTKKRAEQQASVALLAKIVAVAPPVFPEAKTAPLLVAKKSAIFSFDSAKDPVSILMEYSQAHRLGPADFSFVTTGLQHAPTVTCTCTFGDIKQMATAGKKQDAKKAAAKSVIDVLSKSVAP